MKPWSDFYDLLAPDVPGCPFEAQKQSLRQSAIAFCEQSLAWKYTHPDIAIVVAQDEYPYVPPAGAVVHTVTYATFNDTELNVNVDEYSMGIWDWRNQDGVPEFVLGGPASLRLVPAPNVEGTLKLDVILKPSLESEGLDDNIFNEYREAIVHGALGRLMASPKKPYTDLQLSTYHMQQFFAKAGGAGIRVARSYTRQPLRTSIMTRGRREP